MTLKDKIKGMVAFWQEALLLTHWNIVIDFAPIEDTAAEVKIEDMYDEAHICFNLSKLQNKTESFVERTVIHELLHLHDRDRKMMFLEIEACLSPELFKIFERVNYQQTEGFIDRMATALYNLRYSS